MAGSPFHAGEQAVQTRIGVRDRVEKMGQRMVRDFMPDEHRAFFEDLPFLIAASDDAHGALWASLIAGEPGFVQAPEPRRLRIGARTLPDDPLRTNLRAGAPLGLLGIELPTRRRNRVNGRLARATRDEFELRVEQSYGNCKQYIQARAGVFEMDVLAPSIEGSLLSEAAAQVLQHTDTTFIATGSSHASDGGSEGLDASHRGGRPGFIRVEVDATGSVLTLPDFYGNFMFNSFGNLEVNPHAGLLALDFAGGAVLSLTGTAHVVWDGPEVASFAGAERLLQFRPRSGLLWQGVLRGWSAAEQSW
jgi:predicted pyridoxine 5'-phosphate oxidase superfamily flavin-nucleotide-binding protein